MGDPFCKILVLLLLKQCVDLATTLPSETNDGWTLEKELKNNEKLRIEAVDSLREFSLSLPNVKPSLAKDQVIVALLHACDYNLDNAKKRATKYFDFRTTIPEVFANRDLENKDVRSALEVGYFAAPLKRTPEGYRIVILGVRDKDASLFDYTAQMKGQALTMDTCIHEDPTSPGYVLVYDMNGISMRHVFKWNFGLSIKIMKYIQEGIPLIPQQMHFINASAVTQKILQSVRPFMNADILSKMKFHQTSKIETFYQYVPKDYLPKEYGGTEGTLDSLRDDYLDRLRNLQPEMDEA